MRESIRAAKLFPLHMVWLSWTCVGYMYIITTNKEQTGSSRHTQTILDPTEPWIRIFESKWCENRIPTPTTGSVGKLSHQFLHLHWLFRSYLSSFFYFVHCVSRSSRNIKFHIPAVIQTLVIENVSFCVRHKTPQNVKKIRFMKDNSINMIPYCFPLSLTP